MSESRGRRPRASLPDADELTIWAASSADAELLWGWANDVETRRWSFHSAAIPWEAHVAWLDTRLADARTRLFLVGVGGSARAAVRFEAGDDDVAVVSIVVDPGVRGMGWGTRALAVSCEAAARQLALERIDAYIKPENTASIVAFERAGFVHVVESDRPGALKMAWHPASR